MAAAGRFWGRPDVALDMGTESFRLAYVGRRAVLEVRARVAIDPNGRVAATGRRAAAMEERLPDKWRIAYPVEMGRLSHPTGARQLVRLLFAHPQRRNLWKARLWMARPVGITPMERSVLENFLRELPVRSVHWCHGAVAAAVGAGFVPEEEPGLLIVDMGAQRGTAVVLSYGKPVIEVAWPGGGATWTEALTTALEDLHRARLPRGLVEALKRGELEGPLLGQDRLTGMVRELDLPAGFLERVMDEQMTRLFDRLTQVVSRCPPALRLDVQRAGAILVGHGCRVPGLTERFERAMGLGVNLPPDPGRALVAGLVRLARPDPTRQPRSEPPTDLVPLEV